MQLRGFPPTIVLFNDEQLGLETLRIYFSDDVSYPRTPKDDATPLRGSSPIAQYELKRFLMIVIGNAMTTSRTNDMTCSPRHRSIGFKMFVHAYENGPHLPSIHLKSTLPDYTHRWGFYHVKSLHRADGRRPPSFRLGSSQSHFRAIHTGYWLANLIPQPAATPSAGDHLA
ncbi:hypothetical protein EVAR_74878_1 [Eumeta japonica]|uniref:Uncharacterized protein n=1 Tax=Eumeta variegata TaxID=151549 RepID=A0A4C1SPK6_EUMVA|nr:hypothetical protein EVAR_74878_1 [Eumeta japonica]